MRQSTYDPCLLITTDPKCFGIVGMQIDDTIFLGDDAFSDRENKALDDEDLRAKPHEKLSSDNILNFNGSKIIWKDNVITMVQKDQGERIKTKDTKSSQYQHVYLEQRARGAYIASVCQPEATYDLSHAAQYQSPTITEVKALNKRLQWQISNMNRGLRFIPLNLKNAKLFFFVDASFAKNEDLSSQIGYIIIIANEEMNPVENIFKINGNIITWTSVKCKHVTRSVPASELYAKVHGVDAVISLSTTMKLITEQLGFDDIPTIICTDSFSLYECMVKMGTTKEKQLLIDILGIRQSYERREISEIRWINGDDNPADAMTKTNPNKSLSNLVEESNITIRIQGWVQKKENV